MPQVVRTVVQASRTPWQGDVPVAAVAVVALRLLVVFGGTEEMNCPFPNEHCVGTKCGNFNAPDSKWGNKDLPRGCNVDNPTAQLARWYIDRFCKKDDKDGCTANQTGKD